MLPDWIAIDFETEEFDWLTIHPHNAKPLGLSYCFLDYSENEYVNEYTEDLEKIKELLTDWIDNSVELVVFNSYFDLNKLVQALSLPTSHINLIKWEDLYIISKIIDENIQGGLKATYSYYFDEEVSDKYKNIDRNNWDQWVAYAKKDSYMTARLYLLFKLRYPEAFDSYIYQEIEKPLVEAVVDMNNLGMQVDYSTFFQFQQATDEERNSEYQKFKEYFPLCNPNSSQQLSHAFNSAGIYSPVLTKKNAQSWGAEALARLVQYPEVACLAKYKKLNKLKTAFLDPLSEKLEHCDSLDVFASFNPMGTVTGRFSCSNPNLMQIPAHGDAAKLRRAFVPKEGYKFLIGDLSQIELRLLAVYSGDENLLRAYSQGLDVHTETAKLIFQTENPTKEQRFIAKTVGFSVVYGISPEGLQRRFAIFGSTYTLEECENFINTYFWRFPKVENFILYVGKQLYKRADTEGYAYVDTLFGRRRHFKLRGFPQPVTARVRRQGVNFVIQGTCADLAKQIIIKLHKAGMPLNAFVHDEFIASVLEHEAEEKLKLFKEVAESVTPTNFKIPIIIEPKICDSWAEKG